MNDTFIIFSHGFGVDKTDRGLFSDILAALDGVTGVMFNYNDIDESTGNMTVRPLSEQAEALAAVIKTVQEQREEPVSLICHSQGCVVAGLVLPEGVEKIILLNPPVELSMDHLVKVFGDRPGTEINLNSESKLMRADNTITTVPMEYWSELDKIDPVALYNQLAEITELTLIVANQDHVLPGQHPQGVSNKAKLMHLDGDHNFSNEVDRSVMISKVQELLAL